MRRPVQILANFNRGPKRARKLRTLNQNGPRSPHATPPGLCYGRQIWCRIPPLPIVSRPDSNWQANQPEKFQ